MVGEDLANDLSALRPINVDEVVEAENRVLVRIVVADVGQSGQLVRSFADVDAAEHRDQRLGHEIDRLSNFQLNNLVLTHQILCSVFIQGMWTEFFRIV